MPITFEVRGYDGSGWNFIIQPTNMLAFFGSGGYGSPIQVGTFQDSMHIRTSTTLNTDACPPPHLINLKYISANEISVNGGAPVPLTTINQNQCLRISVISDTNITVIGTRLYAFDGVNVNNPPANVIVKAFKHGDNQWRDIHGRANALSLGISNTPATTHHFYFGISISPQATGATTQFVLRFEADIQ